MMKIFLILIFLLGVAFRFIYFPENIYFGYDQARDFYSALSLLRGDLKIVGPPSSFNDQIFHGPLIYYLYSPLLWLSAGSLEAVSLFLRLLNGLGVFLTFSIGSIIFNRKVGAVAAFLFAVSFEQSQFALFLGHPTLAVIPVLSFYLGLALLIFKKEWKGLLFSAISLGLAIQFHYVHVLLIFGFMTMLIIFRDEFKYSLRWKYLIFILGGFLLTISTFLFSEAKYGFRLSKSVLETFINFGGLGVQGGWGDLGRFVYGWQIVQRLITHNFGDIVGRPLILTVIWVILMIWLLINAEYKKRGIFLVVWFMTGILPYVLTRSPSYYYSAGASVSLLILTAFFLEKLWKKWPFVAFLLLAIVTFSNVSMIKALNNKGPNLDMVIQPQMLLSSEKQVLDYIYLRSRGQSIFIRGLTVPLSVNTTWSYLFEKYGKDKYGYLPTWIGPVAEGYAGNLSVINSRSDLPLTQFLIIEPTIGIREGTIQQFFEEEGYFTKVVEEKQFGQFKVQNRKRY